MKTPVEQIECLLLTPRDLADPVHSEAVLHLLDAFALEPVSGGKALNEAVRGSIIPGLRSLASSKVFLARWNGEFVGAAICFGGFSTFQARPLINIHDLIVLQEYRGNGVGRALLSAVASHALSTDCCKLTLEVREDNAEALNLYRSAGFGAGGDEPDAARYLFLEKRL